MKSVIAFIKSKNLYLGIVRYLLGLAMIPYALTKIMRTQFVIIPFSTWGRPLESLSGINLAWAFLGYSEWFQVLVGVLELIPALLLLFRRTCLLGGILMLPMTLNVLLINYALNLWEETKFVALILFALNIVVLIFKWSSIKAVLQVIIGKGIKFNLTPVEFGINTALVIAVGLLAISPLLDYQKQTNDLTGDWYHKHPIEWILQDERLGDSVLAHHELKTYYGPYGNYEEANPVPSLTKPNKYIIDEHKHLLTLMYPDGEKVKSKYFLMADTALKLETITDSLKGTKLTQIFTKRVINTSK